MLLDVGVDPNVQSKSGYTVLQEASIYGHKEVVDLLKKYVY